jgi:hypothetical protein
MAYEDLAKRLADPQRIGLRPKIAETLKLKSEDAIRGQLMAMSDDTTAPLGIYLLAIYVVDDTDLWSDGEIYWWCVPALLKKDGTTSWSSLSGLPTGAPPHRVGSLEWMSNLSLKDPPLLAVVPPDEDLSACVLRLGIYDDDGQTADVPMAMTAGLEALATCKEGLKRADQILVPVRDAIFKSLKAHEDDILMDEDVTIRRGEGARFNVGLVSSLVNSKVRVYYFVKDEQRTETAGPFLLHKGQTETVKFQSKLARGGRVSVFARGGGVSCGVFGDLTTDVPFAGRVLDERTAEQLTQSGFNISGESAAKAIAFYTPP